MAVLVIEVFKVVNIQNHNGHTKPPAHGPLPFALIRGIKLAPIGKAGEGVSLRHILKFFVGDPQFRFHSGKCHGDDAKSQN